MYAQLYTIMVKKVANVPMFIIIFASTFHANLLCSPVHLLMGNGEGDK